LEENCRGLALSGVYQERSDWRPLRSAQSKAVPDLQDGIGSSQTTESKAQISARKTLIVSVTFNIPGALRGFTGGQAQVKIEGSPNVLRDALQALWMAYPGIRDRMATEQGQIREHINIFIGNEDVRYTGGLASPVPAESQISIVPAITGG
jgi:molybdopterin synthase sulfur carrier subunit